MRNVTLPTVPVAQNIAVMQHIVQFPNPSHLADPSSQCWFSMSGTYQLTNQSYLFSHLIYQHQDNLKDVIRFQMSRLDERGGPSSRLTYSIPFSSLYTFTSSFLRAGWEVDVWVERYKIFYFCKNMHYLENFCETSKFGLDCEIACPCNSSNTECFTNPGPCTVRCPKNYVPCNEEKEKRTTTVIPIARLMSYILENGNLFFFEQFTKIPDNHDATKVCGLLAENSLKNEEINHPAYDHSRVLLISNAEENQGEYINASFIQGLDHDIIIASQGPNIVMVDDFLRMLWEQKVSRVVMLDNINDSDEEQKQYWDDTERLFHSMKVKVLHTEVFADYTLRKMEITKVKGDDEVCTLIQFHFTSWPDNSVPCIWRLVDFEHRVFREPTQALTVVHCRNGSTRTSVFLALHDLLMQARTTQSVDFVGTVKAIRRGRSQMIDSFDYYMFLHHALMAAVTCDGSYIHLNEVFLKNLTYITTSFEADPDKEKVLVDHADKNRFNVYTNEMYRPLLHPDYSDIGDYINAVSVQVSDSGTIDYLTQLPLPTTVTDFWRLVSQYDVTLIVAFELELRKNDATIGVYLPESEETPLLCGTIRVYKESFTSGTCFEELTLRLQQEGMGQETKALTIVY
ncbi:receptor-type tyrosine-protein phosphatase T-like [Physella acuta]|uniref:receptor-type tyrosine-protein phosphatase T-like n=1 Tax=Physella acuta TaxID=109671 RepID=UPI0027DB4DA8|nr:receptor-type tyrosine-protein phosphatase T-like [Physella acuta]